MKIWFYKPVLTTYISDISSLHGFASHHITWTHNWLVNSQPIWYRTNSQCSASLQVFAAV